MMEHLQAKTFHARRGQLNNAFTYGVDFVLCDPATTDAPLLMSRNGFNLWSLQDRHHGGPRGAGRGVAWFQAVLRAQGVPLDQIEIRLLTQPSFLWFHFNPVSFWIALRDGRPCAFVAEVNSTFGQRHCYFCAHEDFRAITPDDRLGAQKLMHVSPFQTIAGTYRFALDWSDEAIRIRIFYENDEEGVFATLEGARQRVSTRSLLWAALRRPGGGARVLALIHWRALILFLKRAPFLKRQPPPATLLSGERPSAEPAE